MDTAITSFLIIARFLNININQAELDNLSQSYHNKEGEVLILQLARHYKLKSKLSVTSLARLKEVKSPVIVKSNEGTFFILARIEQDEAMIYFLI